MSTQTHPWLATVTQAAGPPEFFRVPPSSETPERRHVDDILRFLAQCGCSAGGEGFFPELARYLARVLGVEYVCIDRLERDCLAARTLAVFHDGAFEDNVTYTLKDTPCGDVAAHGVCCFPRGVRAAFPRDSVLQSMGAESYVGATLFNSRRQPIGLIAAIGRQPMMEARRAESLLQLVAIRAAGELERVLAEERIRESEARFRKIFDHAAMGIALSTCDGAFVQCNSAYCSLTGYREEELLAMGFQSLIHEEDREENLRLVPRLLAREVAAFEVENRYRHKAGHAVWVHKHVSMLYDDAGNPTHLVALVTDITERRRAQREREVTVLFLRLVSASTSEVRLVRDAVRFIQTHSGCDVVSICMKGREDVCHPTKHGFWLGDPRGAGGGPGGCTNDAGEPCDLVALLPLLVGEDRLGTLRFYHRQSARVSEESFGLWDRLVGHLAVALARLRADEALQASERFNVVVLDSLPAQIAVIDREGRILSVNARWRQFAADRGACPAGSAEVGSNYLMVCRRSAEQGDRLARLALEGIQSVLNGCRSEFQLEYPCHSATSESWFLMLATPITSSADRVILSHHDVTERHQAQVGLASVNIRLQALLNALPVGVSFSDDPSCKRIVGNPAALQQFEMVTTDNLSASAPDAAAPGRQVRFFKNGQPISDAELPLQRAVAENAVIPPMELEVVLPSGRRWIAEASGAPIRSEEGAVVGGVAVTLDVTPRRRAEQARREFEMLANHSTEFIGICDMDFKPYYANQAALRLVGLSDQAEAFRTPVEEFFFPEDRALVLGEFFPRVLRDGSGEMEVRFRHFRTGQPVWMIYSVFVLRGEHGGKPVGLATVSRDISARKQAEEALRKSNEELEQRVRGRLPEPPGCEGAGAGGADSR